MKKLKDYDFSLPDYLIAQTPSYPRGSSKLLYVNSSGQFADHKFFGILEFMQKDDVLVFNNTKVIKALLEGVKISSSFEKTQININLLKQISSDLWQVILVQDTWKGENRKFGQELEVGDIINFQNDLNAEILEKDSFLSCILLKFNKKDQEFFDCIEKIGKIPLPPYIERKQGVLEDDDTNYQTIFAKESGAVAAPTAGLHFDEELLTFIKSKGIKVVFVTLHVSAGTFFPVKSEKIEDHTMHSENFYLSDETCKIINDAKASGGKIISVGTTSMRVLESNTDEFGKLNPSKGETQIFIKPGYQFKIVDRLITNFHTPKSTLFILVSAFAGYDVMRQAYKHAIKNKYKFFSYGDACYLEKNISKSK